LTDKFAEAAGRGMGSAFRVRADGPACSRPLTPCVYPMIPITISHLRADEASRDGAPSGWRRFLRGRHRQRCSGRWVTVFAMLGRAFGTYLASPWVVDSPWRCSSSPWRRRCFGAFRAGAAVRVYSSAWRASGARGAGGVFLMGLVGGLIAAPCTGPPLAGISGLRRHDEKTPSAGFLLLADLCRGDRACRSWAIAGFSMQMPAPSGAVDGGGQERVSGSRSSWRRSTTSRTSCRSSGTLTGHGVGFVGLAAAARLALGLGLALGAVHLTFHDAVPPCACARAFGVAAGVPRPLRPHELRAHAQAAARLDATARRRALELAREQKASRRHRLSWRTGASPARRWTFRSSPTRTWGLSSGRSRCCAWTSRARERGRGARAP